MGRKEAVEKLQFVHSDNSISPGAALPPALRVLPAPGRANSSARNLRLRGNAGTGTHRREGVEKALISPLNITMLIRLLISITLDFGTQLSPLCNCNDAYLNLYQRANSSEGGWKEPAQIDIQGTLLLSLWIMNNALIVST